MGVFLELVVEGIAVGAEAVLDAAFGDSEKSGDDSADADDSRDVLDR